MKLLGAGVGRIPGKQAMLPLRGGILDMTFVRFGFPLKDSERSLRKLRMKTKLSGAHSVREQ